MHGSSLTAAELHMDPTPGKMNAPLGTISTALYARLSLENGCRMHSLPLLPPSEVPASILGARGSRGDTVSRPVAVDYKLPSSNMCNTLFHAQNRSLRGGERVDIPMLTCSADRRSSCSVVRLTRRAPWIITFRFLAHDIDRCREPGTRGRWFRI